MEEKRYAGLSFAQTMEKYAQTVLAACFMKLENISDAQDCAQETFLKLYTKSPDFTDENHLKAWLLSVALNECRYYIRKNRRYLPLTAAEELPFPSPEDSGDISLLLMGIEPKYREVLYLYYGQGYHSEEIAAILRKNHNTVRTLLKRGRDLLKKRFGGDFK